VEPVAEEPIRHTGSAAAEPLELKQWRMRPVAAELALRKGAAAVAGNFVGLRQGTRAVAEGLVAHTSDFAVEVPGGER